MISKIEVERFTLSSSKPFDQAVAALNSAVGHPDIPEFWKSTHRAQSVAELQIRANRTDVVCGVRPRCNCAQRKRSRYTEDDPFCHRQSAYHERNGQACSGRRL